MHYRVRQNRGVLIYFTQENDLVSSAIHLAGKTSVCVAMHCVATHFIISGQGARVALNSSYGLNFCRHMPGLSHRKLAVPPCKSRRLAVPRTGPVHHVGNFRNTSALLSTHSGLSVGSRLSNMCRLLVHAILYKRFCTRLSGHCKVCTSTNLAQEFYT